MALSKCTQIPVGIDNVTMGCGVGLFDAFFVGSEVGKAIKSFDHFVIVSLILSKAIPVGVDDGISVG